MDIDGDDGWDFWLRGFELELEEARRAIDGQRTAVENVRGRASWMMGGGATIAGLLVSLNEHLGVLTYLGLAALGIVGLLTLEILRPRTFSFDMDPNTIRSWTAVAASPAVMVDSLALKHWGRYLDNEIILAHLHRVYVWSTGALVGEVGLITVDVMVH